ncbi:hypothetical protein [Actinoplanes rectilineatus]|uniref:hypothetical protein n=1 Tax=Actinoplanes rectilineatus TaxID=113571 RepID=UPI000698F746|nr:hypothetical protein [Actinoplanes rectilineatus]
MKILLDEQVPEPVIDPLNHLLRWHQIDHVQRIGWKGKKDFKLLPDLAARGYEVLVTADVNQLHDQAECKLIKKYGFHHVRFEQSGKGVMAAGGAIATVIAGLTAVVPVLEKADGQRIVLLKSVRCGPAQYVLCDPKEQPPAYWPGRAGDLPPRQRRRPGVNDPAVS